MRQSSNIVGHAVCRVAFDEWDRLHLRSKGSPGLSVPSACTHRRCWRWMTRGRCCALWRGRTARAWQRARRHCARPAATRSWSPSTRAAAATRQPSTSCAPSRSCAPPTSSTLNVMDGSTGGTDGVRLSLAAAAHPSLLQDSKGIEYHWPQRSDIFQEQMRRRLKG